MSYDLHITRKAHWSEPHGPQISRNEWRAYVEQKTDLRWSDTSQWTPGDDCVDLLDAKGDAYGQIWWERGELTTRRLELPVLIRMMHIAKDLGAVAMGDDGETYRDFDQPGVSRPAYSNPNNHSNAWEEPPVVYELPRSRAPKAMPNGSEARTANSYWASYKVPLVIVLIPAAAIALGNLLFEFIKFFASR